MSAAALPLLAHDRARAIVAARAHARGWTAQFHDEMAFARRYAGTPFWKAAWAALERAATLTGPYALTQWHAYRDLRDACAPTERPPAASCDWCGDKATGVFCCDGCEEASARANREHQQELDEAEGEQKYRCSSYGQHDRELAWLTARGR